jgi:VanZ family protein
MLPLRYARRWQIAGILVLIGVLVAELSPALPDLQLSKVLTDKWLHGLTFAFLTVWFSGQYGRHSYWRLAFGMLAFAALIEVCQRMLTYRSAETMDLVADAVGVAAGLVIAWVGAGGWSLRFENWLQLRQ